MGNGEGVLLRLTGKQAKEYQSNKEKIGMETFVITDLEDAQVKDMLDEKFYSSDELPNKPGTDYYNDTAAHIVDGYQLTRNNCTTLVSDVLNTLGSKALNETLIFQAGGTFGTFIKVPIQKRFVLPASLKKHLESKSHTSNVVYKSK